MTFVKNGRADFDVFGDTIDAFGIKIETLTVKQLEAELATLNKQMADSKKPIEEAAQSTISFGDSIKILGPAQDVLADGTIKISENFNGFNDILSKNGVTILKGTSLLDQLKVKEDDFNTTQVATNVNAQVFEERINAINAELERRNNLNPDLELAQKTFSELLEKTALAQIKNIDATILEIETNALLIGSTQEVAAVLDMLRQKRNNLLGVKKKENDETDDSIAKKKEEEDQLYRTAAATTAIASGLHQMFSESATAEDKMKALLGTLGQLISIAAPTGAGALGGSLLQAFTGFIGHTGGLIQDTGIQRFATGGMVQGGDNVPILAQSGEFIMQRSAVNSIGLQNLAQMNNGAQPTSAFTINIAGDMVGDEDHVRTKVLPAIKEELRREANA